MQKYCSSILVILALSGTAIVRVSGQAKGSEGQSNGQNWMRFSPLDFEVVLPGIPANSSKLNLGKADETDYFRCTKSLEAVYKLDIKSSKNDSHLDIGVFNVTACKRPALDFQTETKHLVERFSADDSDDRIITDEEKKVDGHRGRIFLTRLAWGGFVWQMFVETEHKIFWIIYDTNDPDGSSSAEAKRIFDSFRLRR